MDFQSLAAAALPHAPALLAQWYPEGNLQGDDFFIGDVKGAPGKSFHVTISTGLGFDFASGEGFGDLTAIRAAQLDVTQLEAAEDIAKAIGYDPGQPLPRVRVTRVAPPAPSPLIKPNGHTVGFTGRHVRWGLPTVMHEYRDQADDVLFYVARYEFTDEAGHPAKEFSPWRWDGSGWIAKAPPAPRALYGLQYLPRFPKATILLVEGEKSADAARRVLGGESNLPMTWYGGANAHGKADWEPLRGRRVALWPDADPAGWKAATAILQVLEGIGAQATVVDTTDHAHGWDVADWIAEGGTKKDILAYAKKRKRTPAEWLESLAQEADDAEHAARMEGAGTLQPADLALGVALDERALQVGRPHDGRAPIDSPTDSGAWSVAELRLECNAGGVPHPTVANVSRLLQEHPDWAGKLWHDEFRDRIMYQAGGSKPAAWTDAEDLRATVWIQSVMKLNKVGLQTVVSAVQHVASVRRRNSVRDYLNGLEWDGVERLGTWCADFLGAPQSNYSAAVGKNWLVSMVARAFRPGCQADHMPVLEGKMGRGKSTALEILGGQWYASLGQAFGSHEFQQAIQGVWLAEIPDMAGFLRREHSAVIAAVTTRFDRYRASYGRRAEDHPRVTVFAATSESDDYLPESRGIRRYWPLRCHDIELDGLRGARDQLFAEAMKAYSAGASWHAMPDDETTAEQEARREEDPWLERIANYLASRSRATVADVLEMGLELKAAQCDQVAKRRASRCLQALGWTVTVEKVGAGSRRTSMRVYRAPDEYLGARYAYESVKG
jgi:putative DNA primase/helicase